MTAKETVRAEVLRRRTDRDAAHLLADGDAIARLLPRIDAVAHASCVAVYLSMGAEPPTWPLADLLRERNVRVLTPLVRPRNRLDWAEYAGRDRLRHGAYGISEPTTPPLGVAAVGDADVVVVPALAVDRQGHRLGRGAGYYDRALAYANPVAARIAVVYADELVAHVPTEAHDERVHFAVTPERIWACSAY